MVGLSGRALDSIADPLAETAIALEAAALSATTVLPFRHLAQRGVRVGLGSDGIRDNWGPLGDADMLHRARMFSVGTQWCRAGQPWLATACSSDCFVDEGGREDRIRLRVRAPGNVVDEGDARC